MPSLRELQLRFADALLAPPGAVDLEWLREPAEERLAVYRNTIFANYRNAMAATYAVVRRLVGAPFFNAAVDACVRAHPSTGGDLNVYGSRLGDFLAAYAPAASLPYLPDVARLEWAVDEANRAQDFTQDADSVLATLAAAPAHRLTDARIRFEPSCRFVVSPYPILRIWQVNQPDYGGDPGVSLSAGGDALRIRREPAGRVCVESLAAGDYALSAALAGGATLGAALDAAQAADAHFDFGDALRAALAAGLVAAIVVD